MTQRFGIAPWIALAAMFACACAPGAGAGLGQTVENIDPADGGGGDGGDAEGGGNPVVYSCPDPPQAEYNPAGYTRTVRTAVDMLTCRVTFTITGTATASVTDSPTERVSHAGGYNVIEQWVLDAERQYELSTREGSRTLVTTTDRKNDAGTAIERKIVSEGWTVGINDTYGGRRTQQNPLPGIRAPYTIIDLFERLDDGGEVTSRDGYTLDVASVLPLRMPANGTVTQETLRKDWMNSRDIANPDRKTFNHYDAYYAGSLIMNSHETVRTETKTTNAARAVIYDSTEDYTFMRYDNPWILGGVARDASDADRLLESYARRQTVVNQVYETRGVHFFPDRHDKVITNVRDRRKTYAGCSGALRPLVLVSDAATGTKTVNDPWTGSTRSAATRTTTFDCSRPTRFEFSRRTTTGSTEQLADWLVLVWDANGHLDRPNCWPRPNASMTETQEQQLSAEYAAAHDAESNAFFTDLYWGIGELPYPFFPAIEAR